MHQPRLADLFEEFTRPHTSTAASNSQALNQPTQGSNAITYGASSPASIPSFLPIEDIYVAPQYQPPNPEDEDDVVPDQHAAFGITRAMDRRRDAVWRDLGLEALVSGQGHGGSAMAVGPSVGAGSGPGATLRGSAGERLQRRRRLLGLRVLGGRWVGGGLFVCGEIDCSEFKGGIG
ncbi:uncharacterized protein N7477_003754 [Penicillium maclennaniae]|uniref:uncharacterized protein n=1 Tax=Penicillium maclennaniae TaxID=1343394 RepID=UPI002540E6FC|nr:uncharacterized protein N7477_003754 [Penicillium maclennaniae]KAJ5678121.1 hypothetical protein N7477_003754 [Penicillium maclennaniae]